MSNRVDTYPGLVKPLLRVRSGRPRDGSPASMGKSRHRGVTLVEVIVVIAIIGMALL